MSTDACAHEAQITIGNGAYYPGDCLEAMRGLIAAGFENSFDAVITDPPYGLGFMGKSWDSERTIAFQASTWELALRLLKPGGHLVAFGGSRTYHRLAVAVEDAGFEIRDQILWTYGSGFPKAMDVSKALDKMAGVEREVIGFDKAKSERFEKGLLKQNAGWDRPWMHEPDAVQKRGMITAPTTDAAKKWAGYGTALKPAHEPAVLARKPLVSTVVQNVLEHGTGALNIDGCRVEDGARWPANLVRDGSSEIVDALGDASKFFYCAKTPARERGDSKHPTVKPLTLMRWLTRLVCPPGGVVLDPFAGSGTTLEAAILEGRYAYGCELTPEYHADIEARLRRCQPDLEQAA